MNEITNTQSTRSLADAAQFAMLLEVTAACKPGNIDRFHDYEDTNLTHFLSSTVDARSVFEKIDDVSLGEAFYEAVEKTNHHSGGNTHFGAFILLLPLLKGKGIDGAQTVVQNTTVDDAVLFYKAFGLTQVRMNPDSQMDVNDPASIQMLRDKKMTMFDVMHMSSPNDMVAREWINGFELTRETADLLKSSGGASHIPDVFLLMMTRHADTFVAKKFGAAKAESVRAEAERVLKEINACDSAKESISAGADKISEMLQKIAESHPDIPIEKIISPAKLEIVKSNAGSLIGRVFQPAENFADKCIKEGVNPGSLADICIAGIFVALLEGWDWDC